MEEINHIYIDFYTKLDNGTYALKPRPQAVTIDYIRNHVYHRAWGVFSEAAAEYEQWAWFDEHQEWANSEPTPPELPSDADEEQIANHEAMLELYNEALLSWQGDEPKRPVVRTGKQLMEEEGLSLERFKITREQAVKEIKVEIDGMIFDGDEVSQDRMARAIAAGGDLDSTKWVLADNTVATVTYSQLKRALRAAGEKMTELWIYEAK